MKIRNLVQSFLVLALLCSAVPAATLKHFYYAGTYAASYARNNAYVSYGSKSGQNPFYNFPDNCANFVSQAIIAGMILRTTPAEVFASRADFAANYTGAGIGRPGWYFLDVNNRGSAWPGAQQMYDYANSNDSTKKGLHFQKVGSDTPSNRSLNPLNLWPGDVIFCDWRNDGSINHVIIVTSINYSPFIWNKYDRIRVASQTSPRVDWTLQQIIDLSHVQDGEWPSFRVYRPIDYNQAGR